MRKQLSAKWDEEDESQLGRLIFELEENQEHISGVGYLIDWLRSFRPQKQWRPSDLQIEALESATANYAYSEYQDCLKELTQQLKSL